MAASKRARARSRIVGQVESGQPIDYELPQSEKEDESYLYAIGGGHPANDEMHDPREKSRIPKEGAWVLIIRALPPIAGDLDKQIRVGRVFFAEHCDGADEKGFQQNGTYKVRIQSEWGDVCLWPYEYSMIEPLEVIKMWQDGAMIFHPVNMEAARFDQVTFYLRSRGIPMAQAVVMTLGSILAPIGWFEPEPGLAATLEGMEERINRWNPAKHSPRKSRKRMKVKIDLGQP